MAFSVEQRISVYADNVIKAAETLWKCKIHSLNLQKSETAASRGDAETWLISNYMESVNRIKQTL